jgi:arsenite/tail-anchored protein-transporting ATPase
MAEFFVSVRPLPMSLLELVQRRCVIVTGKGGVGKTTITAALGYALSQKGKRVLLAEIVPSAETPSQLRTAMGDEPIDEEPRLIEENLWSVLLTPTMGHLRFLQDALPLKMLADAAMRSQGIRKFLTAAPGFSDMGVMYRMLDLLKRKHHAGGPLFEVCVIDSPATGHALALAQIPEFLTRVIPGGPIYRAAQEGVAILTDPAVTGCVIVTLPETLPITEALELEKGLGTHRLPVSAIVVNRVPVDPFSSEERAALSAVLPQGVFGVRELRRIERSRSALDLLLAKHPHASITLNEVDGVGAEATKRLVPFLG